MGFEKAQLYTATTYEMDSDGSWVVVGSLTSKIWDGKNWRRKDLSVKFIDKSLEKAAGLVTYNLYTLLEEAEKDVLSWEIETAL